VIRGKEEVTEPTSPPTPPKGLGAGGGHINTPPSMHPPCTLTDGGSGGEGGIEMDWGGWGVSPRRGGEDFHF